MVKIANGTFLSFHTKNQEVYSFYFFLLGFSFSLSRGSCGCPGSSLGSSIQKDGGTSLLASCAAVEVCICSPAVGQKTTGKHKIYPHCQLLLQISTSLQNLSAFVYSSKSFGFSSRVCCCYEREDCLERSYTILLGSGTLPTV